jgi:hypothetical protein
MPYAVKDEKYTDRKVPGTVMIREFNAAFCRVICIPFCFAIRFLQFSSRWVEGINEMPDLMASELLVAFMTRRRNGKSAMIQNRIQITVLKIFW